ncbi:DUF1513 domain-containing protein [Planktotalea sp.]|uniref:DUF1513 domain-containing protein n=1 Tax=Planktotalea sp. TaxID=2029877 RepID=UPI003D6A1571
MAIEAVTGRRQFLSGLLAAGLIPRPTWADAGSPAYLSAAAKANGSFVLCGISDALDIIFEIPLPARAHAASAHPKRPEAVAFARRPGTFAVVIDCRSGRPVSSLETPKGRHFYGHGAFSANGDFLFTTENDYEMGRGRIGVWDASAGYKRIVEIESGGIGPHDIKRLANSDTLVVANGGIDTHPESGRSKLNIPTMRPNLAYIENGNVVEDVRLAPELNKNSIRHLAVSDTGAVAFAMQWQGGGVVEALVGLHKREAPVKLFKPGRESMRSLDGYIGSIAISEDGETIAATSPRGGVLHRYSAAEARLDKVIELADVSGIAATSAGFTATTGAGKIARVDGPRLNVRAIDAFKWDNHLIAL